MIKTIELNVMNIHFIQNIIDVMKKNNEMIELEGFAHIKDIYESNMAESLIGSITDQILS
jgi:type IV secretory pathway VirB4 component